MMYSVIYWASLLGLLASWELVVLDPSRILYWLLLCLGSSALLSLQLGNDEDWLPWLLFDRLALVLFSVGALWWLLWLDFAYASFFIPIVIWGILVYGARSNVEHRDFSLSLRLVLFLGGTFFWATTSFGLLSVIGWQLGQTLLVFLASFSILAWSALHALQAPLSETIRAHLVLVLLGVEFFSVVAWLPLTEGSLALILTIAVLFGYDFIKYYLFPQNIRKRIIIKKILVYTVFLAVVLASTPWV